MQFFINLFFLSKRKKCACKRTVLLIQIVWYSNKIAQNNYFYRHIQIKVWYYYLNYCLIKLWSAHHALTLHSVHTTVRQYQPNHSCKSLVCTYWCNNWMWIAVVDMFIRVSHCFWKLFCNWCWGKQFCKLSDDLVCDWWLSPRRGFLSPAMIFIRLLEYPEWNVILFGRSNG